MTSLRYKPTANYHTQHINFDECDTTTRQFNVH